MEETSKSMNKREKEQNKKALNKQNNRHERVNKSRTRTKVF